MLEHLDIRNYALIENLEVDFSEGFNVITGETGAGKSIILGALGLLMGEKADSTAIRNGADEIIVNAIVSIPENHEIVPWLKERDIEPEDGQIIIKRTVKTTGRSVILVQGQIITRQELEFLASSVIDMHGQSEHQSLLSADKQRKIVDSYAGSDQLLKDCAASYHRICDLKKKKEELNEKIEEGIKQRDYLVYALNEIEAINPNEEEENTLKENIEKAANSESIFENFAACLDKLREVKNILYDAKSYCSKAAKNDNGLLKYLDRIESLQIDADDIVCEAGDYLSGVDFSEEAVNQMQERLASIQKLKRKYGPTVENVLAFVENARITLDVVDDAENQLANCDKDLADECSHYNGIAGRLSDKRHKAAEELELKIENTLHQLGMPYAEFVISVTPVDEKYSIYGFDKISFDICANKGEIIHSIKDVASGGELSRIMLALKTVLAKADSIQTQVFDEVDSGIGGSVALSLASCICDLAKTKQVISITHLAAIASKADAQFVVTKSVNGDRTFSNLVKVSGEQRVHEIARMLSGDDNEVTLEHARSLLS